MSSVHAVVIQLRAASLLVGPVVGAECWGRSTAGSQACPGAVPGCSEEEAELPGCWRLCAARMPPSRQRC